jgi:hypothetical protein
MSKVLSQKKGDLDFFIEVSDEPTVVQTARAGGSTASVDKSLVKLQNKLEDISKTISLTCDAIKGKITSSEEKTTGARISELEIEFGIKISVAGNIIIASGSGEATLKVTAKIAFNK